MADYTGFFLNSKSSVVELQTIEIDHANFSAPVRIVRNKADGLVATLEAQTRLLGDVDGGIAVSDAATGTGWILHSIENVFDRFSNSPYVTNSKQMIAVRYTTQWEYNPESSSWYAFTPVASDLLLADVDFTNDTITSLQGATGQINGINQGFSGGDLTFFANIYQDKTNVGEFTIEGTEFIDNVLVDATFDYYPTRVKEKSTKEDLDYSLDIDFGDVGTVLAEQLDLIAAVDNFITKPEIQYRLYRSDDLSSPMLGPIELEIKLMSFNKKGVSFEIAAPMVNTHSTGEKYTILRFPILRSLA